MRHSASAAARPNAKRQTHVTSKGISPTQNLRSPIPGPTMGGVSPSQTFPGVCVESRSRRDAPLATVRCGEEECGFGIRSCTYYFDEIIPGFHCGAPAGTSFPAHCR